MDSSTSKESAGTPAIPEGTKANSFFTPMANTKPYFKAAFQGFAGTGKTFTSAQVAVGLHKEIKSTKPVIIVDTEKASKFLAPYFKENGIEVLVKESRSLADAAQAIRLAEQGASDILIIDSISHIWEDFLEAYKKRKKSSRLEMLDWGIIKPTWKREFSDLFVASKCHIIMTGRAGYEYESEKNEDTGKREIYKSGIKMKVEGETAYEPDILVLMERFEEILTDKKKIYRQATVLKDRSNIIDGKTFIDPKYDDFAPAIHFILADAAVEDPFTAPEANTGSLFDMTDEGQRNKFKRREIIEEIEGQLIAVAPGQSAAEKKFKAETVFQAFGTYSWTAVEGMPLEKLSGGLDKVLQIIEAAKEAKASAEKEGTDPAAAVTGSVSKVKKDAPKT